LVKKLLLAGVAGLVVLAVRPAHAANISAAGNPLSDARAIYIRGVIERDDLQKFKHVIEENKITRAVVILDSSGGHVLSGIGIGNTIREKGFTTFVPNGNMCSSMCAAVWLAGTPRLLEEHSKIGFHAAAAMEVDSSGRPTGTVRNSGWGDSLIGAYYARLGFDDWTITYMTTMPHTSIKSVSPEELQKMGFQVTILPANMAPLHYLNTKTPPPESPPPESSASEQIVPFTVKKRIVPSTVR
jgi:hypothetical protein